MSDTDNGKVRKSAKGPKYGGGSRKGVPNKATSTAREAFAKLVEGNAPRMQKWLLDVANGIPIIDPETKLQVERNNIPLWIVEPQPEKALDVLQKMAEYHIPKLARTEHVGDSKQPIEHVVKFAD